MFWNLKSGLHTHDVRYCHRRRHNNNNNNNNNKYSACGIKTKAIPEK